MAAFYCGYSHKHVLSCCNKILRDKWYALVSQITSRVQEEYSAGPPFVMLFHLCICSLGEVMDQVQWMIMAHTIETVNCLKAKRLKLPWSKSVEWHNCWKLSQWPEQYLEHAPSRLDQEVLCCSAFVSCIQLIPDENGTNLVIDLVLLLIKTGIRMNMDWSTSSLPWMIIMPSLIKTRQWWNNEQWWVFPNTQYRRHGFCAKWYGC